MIKQIENEIIGRKVLIPPQPNIDTISKQGDSGRLIAVAKDGDALDIELDDGKQACYSPSMPDFG